VITSSRLEVRLLGRPELRFDGMGLAHVTPPRIFSLLAFLIVNRDRRLTRAAVASALWIDELEDDARSNLRRHLNVLNAGLPKIGVSWILATTTTLQWNPEAPAWIDIVEFERLGGDDDTAVDAAALYRGDFLQGHFEDWMIGERERFQNLFLDIAYGLAVRSRGNRDFMKAAEYADRVLALGEWREDALRLKMAAAYEMGDRAGALAAFDRFVKMLSADVGVDVMPETRALRDAIVANVPLASEGGARAEHSAQPIVGRDDELARLLSAWQLTARRAGTTVFVGGEAGIGKTRLLAEFAQAVEMQGGHALVGHAREGEGAPYQPLVDVVRAGAPYLVREELADVWLSALAPLVPELLRLHPDLPNVPTIEDGKLRLHEAFARVLESLARRRPVAVILEDLHWANADTLAALEHLARRAGSAHIMLVATYRPEEAASGHPLRTLRRQLQREHRATIVALGPLDREAIRALVAEAAPDAPEPETFADSIFRSTEGNPLFAWQLLQGYLETGSLSDESVAIDQAIVNRAARLPATTRRVLDVASLIGERFSVEELAEIGAWSENDVVAAIDALLDLRLLRFTTAPGLDLSFAHRLIRDAISAQAPSAGRSALHRRIAAVLGRLRDGETELVASHHALAGDRQAAYEGYLRSAREALAMFANDDAARRARRAVEVAGDDGERFHALIATLDAYRMSANSKDWEDASLEAQALAGKLGNDERFEELRRRCRFLEISARPDESQIAAAEMLAVAEATGKPQHRMHAFHQLGRIDVLQGQAQPGVVHLQAALDAAPPSEHAHIVKCLAFLAHAYARLGETERATQVVERLRAAIGDDPDPEIEAETLIVDFYPVFASESESAYRNLGERYLNVSTKLGNVSGVLAGHTLLAQAAYMRGDLADARRRFSEALQMAERHGLTQSYVMNSINLGCMERDTGNFAAASGHWDRAIPLALQLRAKSSHACILLNQGEAALAQGDAAAAAAQLEVALARCREVAEPRLISGAATALGAAKARLGECDAGFALMREAIALRRSTVGGTRALASAYAYLIEELIDAGEPAAAAAEAAQLLELHRAADPDRMFETRNLSVLARAAKANGDDAAARTFIDEGRKRFAVRMAELPDEETRAAFAALAFNRVYGAEAQEPTAAPSKARA
jgi:DNA-binding SARP family transcriptional activator